MKKTQALVLQRKTKYANLNYANKKYIRQTDIEIYMYIEGERESIIMGRHINFLKLLS